MAEPRAAPAPLADPATAPGLTVAELAWLTLGITGPGRAADRQAGPDR